MNYSYDIVLNYTPISSILEFYEWRREDVFTMIQKIPIFRVSDLQMKKFIKTRTSRDQVIDIGLWKYSRHPNYLGEISIWFGVALVLIINNPSYWYYLMGAVINLLMFLFISIPMEENHMKQYKPGIIEYIKTTSCLLVLPKKRQSK